MCNEQQNVEQKCEDRKKGENNTYMRGSVLILLKIPIWIIDDIQNLEYAVHLRIDKTLNHSFYRKMNPLRGHEMKYKYGLKDYLGKL